MMSEHEMTELTGKAGETLEALKAELVDQTIFLGEAGRQLQKTYPRYGHVGEQMALTSDTLTRRCNEALYSLALGAAFQSGKSTTCNAFADGREICPCGNGGGGIRTSSCAVQINNTQEDRAGASIVWMKEEELNAALADALGLSEEGTAISLQKPQDRDAAWQQVLDMVEDFLADNARLSDTQKDGMKQALLILTYCQEPQLEVLRQETEYPLDQAQRFLSFPPDAVARWNTVFKEYGELSRRTPKAMQEILRRQWPLENAIYPFISIANFYTPSEYLRSLGVVVTDTPGLNMTASDTRVALAAMSSASAIFYFFNGTQELSQEDRASLRKLQECGLGDKVFFGINFRTSAKKREAIEQSILATLEQMGFVRRHQRSLLHFNAFLAQRAKQGLLLLAGKLDEGTRQSILNCAEEWDLEHGSVEEAWLSTTAEVMSSVKAAGYKELEDLGLCQESVDMVLQASCWQETMDAINDFVLHNRGRVLLLDQVAQPISRQLRIIEAELLSKEAEAEQEYTQLKATYDAAADQYGAFERESSKVLEQYITPTWDRRLAEDFYDKVIQASAGPAADKAAEKVMKLSTSITGNLGHLGTSFFNHFRKKEDRQKSKLEVRLEKAILDALSESVEERSIAWMEHLESSDLYRTTVRDNVENVMLRIRDIWAQTKMNDNAVLEKLGRQLEEKLPNGTFSTDAQNIQLSNQALTSILGKNNINVVGSLFDILKGFGAGYGAMVGLTYVYLFVLPLDFVVPGAAEIIAVAGVIIGALVSWLSSSARKAKKLQEKKNELRLGFLEKFTDSTFKESQIQRLQNGDEDNPNAGLKIYRLFYENVFKDILNQTREDLDRRAQEALAAASEGQLERQKIAEEAKEIRQTIVRPLQDAMEHLEQRIEEACPLN